MQQRANDVVIVSTAPESWKQSEALEEERLLGIRRHHAHDRQISKPKTEWEREGMPSSAVVGLSFHSKAGLTSQFRPAGPRPINTLNRDRQSKNETQRKPNKSIMRKLQIETVPSSKQNGAVTSQYWASGHTQQHPSKRRKTGTSPVHLTSSSSSDIELGEAGEPRPRGLKTLGSQNLRSVTVNSRTHSTALELHQGAEDIPPVNLDVSRKPDGMVVGGRKTRAQKKWARRNSSQNDEAASSPKTHSTVEAYSVHDSEDEIQLVPPENPVKSFRTNPGGKDVSPEQNEGFVDSTVSKRNGQVGKARSRILQPQHHEKQLREAFRSVDGGKRGVSSGLSSPDELLAGNTLGNVKLVRSQSPEKRIQSKLSGTRGQHEQTQSRSTKGTNSLTKGTKLELSKDGNLNEASGMWAVDIDAINRPVTYQRSQHKPWQLAFDEGPEEYFMTHDDKRLRSAVEMVRIFRAKIQDILHDIDGTRLRIRSSKQEGLRDNHVELELSHRGDLERCLQHMQLRRPLKCVGKDRYARVPTFTFNELLPNHYISEHITKLFATSRRETEKRPLPAERPSQNTLSKNQCKGAQDMDKESWDQAMQQGALGKPKRTRLVDDLVRKADDEKISDFQISVSEAGDTRRSSRSSRQPLSDMGKLLKQLKVDHVPSGLPTRRSTRVSSSAVGIADQVSASDLEPSVPKYSEDPGLGPRWKRSLVYPPTGKKKATVDWIDLEKLDEGEFLNDALVTFKMRQLEHSLEESNPELAKRIYFFNTFFYGRLRDHVNTKEINYAAVQKWTKNVDIFTYDYIVIPINEMAHWYLAIICNLPGLERAISFSDESQPLPQASPAHESTPRPSGESETTAKDFQENPLSSPIETHVRSSFAEISLEDPEGMRKEIDVSMEDADQKVQVRNDDAVDDEMLEVPRRLSASNSEDPQPLDEAENSKSPTSPAAELISTSKQTRSPRKLKRKSLPAVMSTDPSVPLIMVLDSLGGSHPTVIRLLKDYLAQEAIAKRGGMEVNAGAIKGINAKSIPLQSNFSDCGLYMLGYLDKFLQEGAEFIRKTIKRDYDKTNWRINSSEMRSSLRTEIFDFHDLQEQEARAAKASKKRSNQGDSPPGTATAPKDQVQDSPPGDRVQSRSRRTSPVSRQQSEGEMVHPPLTEFEETPAKQDPRPAAAQDAEVTDDHISPASGPGEIRNTEPSQDDASLVVLESQSGPVATVHESGSVEDSPTQPNAKDMASGFIKSSNALPAEVQDSQPRAKSPSPQMSPHALKHEPSLLEQDDERPSGTVQIEDSFVEPHPPPSPNKRSHAVMEGNEHTQQPPKLPPRKAARLTPEALPPQKGVVDQGSDPSSKTIGQRPITDQLTYGQAERRQSNARRHESTRSKIDALPTSERFKQKQKKKAEQPKMQMQFFEERPTRRKENPVVELE